MHKNKPLSSLRDATGDEEIHASPRAQIFSRDDATGKTKGKGWPPERRKAQAERAHLKKPWTSSTGPKTPEGKARSSRNAMKHGTRSAPWRELRSAFRMQRQSLNRIKAAMRDRSFDDGTQDKYTQIKGETLNKGQLSSKLFSKNETQTQLPSVHSDFPP